MSTRECFAALLTFHLRSTLLLLPLLLLLIPLILPSLSGFMDAARTEMIRECAFTFEVALAVAAPELCRGTVQLDV
jgi:hypothetical protein